MGFYKKKPVVIEAKKFTREIWKEIQEFTGGKAINIVTPRCIDGIAECKILTFEGSLMAKEGDYIIKGVQGEFYPCKPDLFKATYESAVE